MLYINAGCETNSDCAHNSHILRATAEVALRGQILQAGLEGKTIRVDHNAAYATVSVTPQINSS
jgi:hypothetical protein